MKFRKADAKRLTSAEAQRQGQITTLAFHLLGRDSAITFLNDRNARLGARPIDLAISGSEGCARIEEELRRLTIPQARESGGS